MATNKNKWFKEFTAKGMNALIVTQKEQAAAWMTTTSMMLVGACFHAHECGDVQFCQAAYESMPRGAKTKSALKFLLKHAPVRLDSATKKLVSCKRKRSPDFCNDVRLIEKLLDENDAMHWSYSVNEGPDWAGFDLKDKLEGLLKRLDKATEKASGNPDMEAKINAPDASIAALRSLLASL